MKLKTVILMLIAAVCGVQVHAAKVSHPMINCNDHGRLAEAVMMYKLGGASKEKITKAMKATGDTSPHYEIQANLGMTIINKAFEVEPPNSKNDFKVFAQKFGQEQAAWCKEKTDIELPDSP